MEKKGPVIAIDGPAGSGKSTVTKRLCQELGYTHVDSGALYRAIALSALEQGIPLEQQEKIVTIAEQSQLEFQRTDDADAPQRLFSGGKDVTEKIRTPEVSSAASQISAIPGVRAALLDLQRQLGCVGKTILEGRDIGTVIFPDADVKFFLQADLNERTRRRMKDLEEKKIKSPDFEDLKNQIQERDERDRTRETAPLKKAEDAIELDTSSMSIEEVVSKMKEIVLARV